MDTKLQKIIEEMVEEERHRKKPKAKGKIAEIRKTRNGNLIFILEDERRLLVNKNSGLFKIANNIISGDMVYAEGGKGINIIFCDRLKVLNRNVSVNQSRLNGF